MKSLFNLVSVCVTILLVGCATQNQVARQEGRGSRQIYATPFDQTWRAAIDAAQDGDLEIVSADRARGYIAARRGVRAHTLGENVGVWVKEVTPTQTEVEVVSRQAGPPVMWLKNWQNEIQRAIAANLTREGYGGAPATAAIESGAASSRAVAPDRIQDSPGDPAVMRNEIDQLRRELDVLRTRQEGGNRALSAEVDETKRRILERQMERLREETKVLEGRLLELERQLN